MADGNSKRKTEMNQANTAANTAAHYVEATHDEIALCAFLIWERDGRQPGNEKTYWLQAEAQLRASRQAHAEEVAAKAARPWPPSAGRTQTVSTPVAPTQKVTRIPTANRADGLKSATASSSRKSLARA